MPYQNRNHLQKWRKFFLKDINNIHENIKFTMSHTKPAGALGCECAESNSIPFLDTSLEIKEGKIVSDLYRKPSDRNKYLLPSSAHPSHVTKSTPYSLALLIVRNCSEPEARDRRLEELKEMLLARDYKLNIINDCIRKARAIPRHEALKDVERCFCCIQIRKKPRKSAYQSSNSQASPRQREKDFKWNAQM